MAVHGPGAGRHHRDRPVPGSVSDFLIVAPLGLAWATEALAARRRIGAVLSSGVSAAMVPLMAATLLVVVASQIPAISHRLGHVVAVVPLYAAFLVIMAGVGYGLAWLFRLDTGRSRALIFTRATRNSLVVLPLALALHRVCDHPGGRGHPDPGGTSRYGRLRPHDPPLGPAPGTTAGEG